MKPISKRLLAFLLSLLIVGGTIPTMAAGDSAPVMGDVFLADDITVAVRDNLQLYSSIKSAFNDATDDFVSSDDSVLAWNGSYYWEFDAKKSGTATLSYRRNGVVYDTLTVHVTEARALSLDTPMSLQTAGGYHRLRIPFVSQDYGEYIFTYERYRADIHLYDEQNNVVSADSGYGDQFTYTLKANTAYYLWVHSSDTADIKITVTHPVVPPVDFWCSESFLTMAVGESCFLPGGKVLLATGETEEYSCSDTLTYAIADERVATFSGKNSLTGLAPGTTTLTVIFRDGWSDTIPVRVTAEPTELPLSMGTTPIYHNELYDERYYKFTAPEDGWYRFDLDSAGYPYFLSYDQEGNLTNGWPMDTNYHRARIYVKMPKGESRTFTLPDTDSGEVPATFTVSYLGERTICRDARCAGSRPRHHPQ